MVEILNRKLRFNINYSKVLCVKILKQFSLFVDNKKGYFFSDLTIKVSFYLLIFFCSPDNKSITLLSNNKSDSIKKIKICHVDGT